MAQSSAVDAHTGQKAWQFDTIGGDERSRASWGNDSWKTGGGGGWMTGTYDAKYRHSVLGHGKSRRRTTTIGQAARRQSCTRSGVVALDPGTGVLKSFFQEVPHDSWDFDGAVGEFVMIDRGGQHYAVHPNKGGYVYVYNRDIGEPPLKIENVWHLGETSNFVSMASTRTPANSSGRHDVTIGKT